MKQLRKSEKKQKIVRTKHRTKPARRASALVVASDEHAENHFPIVGVGASAGGLEAFTQLLEALPTDAGVALVFIQHLDPTHESMLTNLLAKATSLPVLQVEDGMSVMPNHVYVIPPNTNMAILHGTLNLMPRADIAGQHLSIDYFFRSLAEDQKSRAIGVILSGTASDGTLGLRAIKAEGGLTFAQSRESAKYDGMPHSAIASGMADLVLPPHEIARELAHLGQHLRLARVQTIEPDELPAEEKNDLSKIFIMLRMETGIDFANYKPTTIKRRIARRMMLQKIDALAVYRRYLKDNPSELGALYQDLLINVTSFFRDPGTFESLKRKVFPQLLKDHARATPIRIWVPGCSTGEEAYAIAIALLEYWGDRANDMPIQIFATDINDLAIDHARTGIYRENISIDVSPERLSRFFVKVEGGYQVSKALRSVCVFSRQDVTRDPPFSKLDLISCRNVLIYMGAVLQKRIIPVFHYALNPGGTLVLGNSETIGEFADLFSLADKKHKIYSKKSAALRLIYDFAMSHSAKMDMARSPSQTGATNFDAPKEADRIALARYVPAGVLVNDNLDIVQFRGHTGLYLEPASGAASLNLLKMARQGLMLELRTALDKARKSSDPIRKMGVQVKINGGFRKINLEVIPIKPHATAKERYFLVLFESATPTPGPALSKTKPSKTKRQRKIADAEQHQLTQLQHELTATKEYLQSLGEQQERTNEELHAALEEIQSSNEELQSTNEELETAKEELQSTNEELTTVNEELQNRNIELGAVNNDLVNLLTGVSIPIVILGKDLSIRRFTPTAEKVLGFIPSDVGRPLSNLRLNIVVPNLEALIQQVIDTLTVHELEAQDREGHWYSLRIRPYKTLDSRIDGVVLMLLDIDQSKRNLVQVREALDYAHAIIETVREALLILDGELHVRVANRAFYRMFQVTPEETENRFLYNLGSNQWNIPRLRELLEEILPKNSPFEDFQVDAEFPRVGHKRLILNARRINQQENRLQLILLAIEEASM
ncbi:Chemotaxis protein methyltransferase Cher2 [Anaerolineae bacterium]|nr:Chemotaxis protein methyltransferase Cher2 [Anaerolineae bacterium]